MTNKVQFTNGDRVRWEGFYGPREGIYRSSVVDERADGTIELNSYVETPGGDLVLVPTLELEKVK